ncbi:hypothetical protein D6833_05335 [Candidatus Parcubacteria bacterium]|nr:MAG: hypothetical protein D6833_05335 [Candidatus Parcubacteria bacterium]
MDQDHPYHPSLLFTVRLWPEEVDAGQVEWRGEIRHVLSGDARYFRDWPTLIEHLVALLPADEAGRVGEGIEGKIV